MPTSPAPCFGAFAMELRPGTHAAHAALDPQRAAAIAAGIARDLAILVPEAAGLDLAVLGAHYDPIELLRPGWPLHAALDALAGRAPVGANLAPNPTSANDEGRILAFGTRDGALPEAVPSPDPEFSKGTLRLVPFLLRGDADTQARVAAALEELLADRGMAGAATALDAQDAFGAPIEHARYLTLHDLAALMALQYEHAGLAQLWPLIEAALLAPHAEAWLDAPPEPLAHYTGGDVHIAMIDAEAWRDRGYAPSSAGDDADKLETAYEYFEARQRQIAAVLGAHGIPVMFDHCPAGKDPHEVVGD